MEMNSGQKTILHVFDVDGTLTRSDSLLLLIQMMRPGGWGRLLLWLSVLPVLPVAFLKNDSGMIKQALLKKLWKGKSKAAIETIGVALFAGKLQNDLRPAAQAYIEKLRQDDPAVGLVLLSASCRPWLQPLAAFLQADLICTEPGWDVNGRFTGRFATPNCKGPEKVRRLLVKYPAAQYAFVCYADDASDRPLQSISSQFFYRYF